MGNTQPAWDALRQHANRLRQTTLRDLFSDDRDRFNEFSIQACDMLVDLSKEKIDASAWQALFTLAEAADLTDQRSALFAGDIVNKTEGRAALHMALRASDASDWYAAGVPVMEDVVAERQRMLSFASAVRSGTETAVDGAPYTDIINIGIGGSDLGPVMAVQALHPFADGPRVHFVSNLDGAHLTDTIATLDPRRTLVIVASKTFTTLETMHNAHAARSWLATALGAHAGEQIAAVSTNLTATSAFGVGDARVFGFWDWVGGRYSVWSSIGLPVAIAVGQDNFQAFLGGAAAMDDHFRSAPTTENLPIRLALTGIWRRNLMGCPAVALIPYSQRLARLAAYVQQLDMESNGKRTDLDGARTANATGPLIFGEPGTNSQHSFFQLLHQGTDVIPVDFIGTVEPSSADADAHRILMASMLAQSAALAFGRTTDEAKAEMMASGSSEPEGARLSPHKTFPGDRPSTTILMQRLDPSGLGALIAMFEHKVFVQAAIWGINPFDQWGVELGKNLTADLAPAMIGGDLSTFDASTAGLVHYLRGGGGDLG